MIIFVHIVYVQNLQKIWSKHLMAENAVPPLPFHLPNLLQKVHQSLQEKRTLSQVKWKRSHLINSVNLDVLVRTPCTEISWFRRGVREHLATVEGASDLGDRLASYVGGFDVDVVAEVVVDVDCVGGLGLRFDSLTAAPILQ